MKSLGDVTTLLLEYLQKSTSASERRALEIASGAAAFISRSGQVYQFEDFHKSTQPGRIQSLSYPEVNRVLAELLARKSSASEKETLHVAMSALPYVEASGQKEAFEEHLTYWNGDGIPYVIAAFKTREEAEAWLDAQPVPPTKASILIGDEYHRVMARRERRDPPFVSFPLIAEFLERETEVGLPPSTAAFHTLKEAYSWFANHPEQPRHAFITIGGEYHLAVYWRNIHHRAIYPFTIVAEMQKAKRERDEWLERLKASAPEEGEGEGEGEEDPEEG